MMFGSLSEMKRMKRLVVVIAWLARKKVVLNVFVDGELVRFLKILFTNALGTQPVGSAVRDAISRNWVSDDDLPASGLSCSATKLRGCLSDLRRFQCGIWLVMYVVGKEFTGTFCCFDLFRGSYALLSVCQ